MAETFSTNFSTESGKNLAPIFVFASLRKKKIGRELTATVTLWAAAAMENQVRFREICSQRRTLCASESRFRHWRRAGQQNGQR